MFSIARVGVISSLRLFTGVRFISKGLSDKEVYEILDKQHYRHTIPAFKREGDGKNCSRHLRKNGAIPGVLYGSDGKGHDDRVLIAVPTNEVDRWMTRLNLSLECTLFTLDIEGEKVTVFPRDLQCHPSTPLIVCYDFVATERPEALNFIRMNYEKGTTVQIPIRYYNQEKNFELKTGGFLATATRYVDVRVMRDVDYVPPHINCNVEKLTHKAAFGIDKLDFDRTQLKAHPKMNSRIFASISGKVKEEKEAAAEVAA